MWPSFLLARIFLYIAWALTMVVAFESVWQEQCSPNETINWGTLPFYLWVGMAISVVAFVLVRKRPGAHMIVMICAPSLWGLFFQSWLPHQCLMVPCGMTAIFGVLMCSCYGVLFMPIPSATFSEKLYVCRWLLFWLFRAFRVIETLVGFRTVLLIRSLYAIAALWWIGIMVYDRRNDVEPWLEKEYFSWAAVNGTLGNVAFLTWLVQFERLSPFVIQCVTMFCVLSLVGALIYETVWRFDTAIGASASLPCLLWGAALCLLGWACSVRLLPICLIGVAGSARSAIIYFGWLAGGWAALCVAVESFVKRINWWMDHPDDGFLVKRGVAWWATRRWALVMRFSLWIRSIAILMGVLFSVLAVFYWPPMTAFFWAVLPTIFAASLLSFKAELIRRYVLFVGACAARLYFGKGIPFEVLSFFQEVTVTTLIACFLYISPEWRVIYQMIRRKSSYVLLAGVLGATWLTILRMFIRMPAKRPEDLLVSTLAVLALLTILSPNRWFMSMTERQALSPTIVKRIGGLLLRLIGVSCGCLWEYNTLVWVLAGCMVILIVLFRLHASAGVSDCIGWWFPAYRRHCSARVVLTFLFCLIDVLYLFSFSIPELTLAGLVLLLSFWLVVQIVVFYFTAKRAKKRK